jgi:TM2 domain-containing membrane protein YozV
MCNKEPEITEVESYCGYCGERLPSMAHETPGACPRCQKRFGIWAHSHPPPLPPEVRWERFVRAGPANGPQFKDPVLAALLSTVMPGGGQVYNGHFLKGFLVFITCWLVIPYFLGIMDAYVSARDTNRYQAALKGQW